ncbi:MAG: toprim domain-containing protein [Pseudomonadota bacterium]|nr:toprim domain-containing protein [Pseudomonadota bacterium]
MDTMIESEAVRCEARGRWVYILGDLLPGIRPALENPGRHVDCPFHGGRKDFRVFRDVDASGGAVCTCGAWGDGFALLMYARGQSFPDSLAEVARWLGIAPSTGTTRGRWSALEAGPRNALPDRVAAPRRPSDEWLAETMREIWNAAKPIEGREPVLNAYLRARGLSLRLLEGVPSVRFHPSLAYRDDRNKITGRYPALVFAVTDPRGRGVTMHRLYLAGDGHGKAPVEAPRKMMPVPAGKTILGGAIRLARFGPVLGVAEGMETALAVRKGSGLPCWSCVSADVLAAFEPPPGVRRVVVWADKDRSGKGESVARRLEKRLRQTGVDALVLRPPLPIADAEKGVDWADVLAGQGVYGFPNPAVWRVA